MRLEYLDSPIEMPSKPRIAGKCPDDRISRIYEKVAKKPGKWFKIMISDKPGIAIPYRYKGLFKKSRRSNEDGTYDHYVMRKID